ncbi:MAG TPA: EAL domain-containing protein, partial [Candidatus Aquilonibacter sp.]|nr:EAL domain-containing protein [Candidatus Aquilonibacter sp.]
AQALEIVRAIVALAQTLGFHVTAEGVERPEQFELLKFLDVEYAQGFFFSQPVDFATAKAFFAVRS